MDPFLGTATGYNPTYVSQQNQLASTQAQAAYQQSMMQNQNDQLAFQKAQAAFTDAMSLGSAYGYSMGGNPYNFGSMMLPQAGTPLQSTMNTLGSGGAIPGVTGFNTGTTASYQQQLQQMAQSAAGLTGFYNAPRTSQFSPGTFVNIDPSTYDPSQGTQMDYVLPSGQLQRVSTTQAKQMGWSGSLADLSTIPFSQAALLESAPPQYLPQQTMQSLQQYQQMNTQAQQNALATSQATGMYATPSQIYAPGTNAAGGTFQTLDQATQQAYFYSNGGDWTAAMNKWVADSNAAIAAASPGGQLPNQAGTPQETLQAQNQYFNQAQQYAQTYGQYYAPGAPGQAGVAGTNAPQAGQQTLAGQQQAFSQNLQTQQFQQQSAQQYLQLLSQLQGPADYGQYLKVLGSTPGGIQGLVGAAAGNYIPGGGSTGVAPQAQTLQNLVGAATGYPGGQASQGGQGGQQFDMTQLPGYQSWMAGTGNQSAYAQSLAAAASGQAGSGYGSNPAGQQSGTGSASPGGMNYQDFLATAQGLPAPSQLAPQSFNAMTPSQQQMLGSMYSNLGYAPGDINAMYQQSLPKYAAGSSSGNFRLV
jgi:hypothetical protein